MLKHRFCFNLLPHITQPPSGGCVLKHHYAGAPVVEPPSAAFGRLCVETISGNVILMPAGSAAFGRLCVETLYLMSVYLLNFSAAFGRLCVETIVDTVRRWPPPLSRLRAAVC